MIVNVVCLASGQGWGEVSEDSGTPTSPSQSDNHVASLLG
jgi:hypothetical protein